jgi:hypothetical protein
VTATWIIIGGAAILALILAAAVVITLIATRTRTKPLRIPGLGRLRPPDGDTGGRPGEDG